MVNVGKNTVRPMDPYLTTSISWNVAHMFHISTLDQPVEFLWFCQRN